MSLGLMRAFQHMDGVRRVERVKRLPVPSSNALGDGARPSGSSGRAETVMTPMLVPTKMPAVDTMQADQWHRAGFTGAGVEVAVIDDDFREFRTRVLPHLSGSVKFLCYGPDASGVIVPREGEISVATSAQGGTPAGFSMLVRPLLLQVVGRMARTLWPPFWRSRRT